MSLYDQLAQLTFSPECYISGYLALNIADFENHTGDWHETVFWNKEATLKNSFIMGKKSPTAPYDTNYYFGPKGLFKANDVLKIMGIPQFSENIISANHARAIADLVLYAVIQLKNPSLIIDSYSFDDFMELPSDKQKVYDLLETAIPKLPSDLANLVTTWLNQAKSTI